MANFLTKIFGTHSSHELKKIYPIADKVDALEEQFKKLTDDELRAKTDEFKQRYQNGETLDQLLPEAFATCREAAWRVLGMRHYRVQIIGGIVLHQGRIAEMKTGEGKTLVATLPAYLNAPQAPQATAQAVCAIRSRGAHTARTSAGTPAAACPRYAAA